MYNLRLPPQLRPAPSHAPQRTARRFPLSLLIPPERAHLPGLALPVGCWERLPDGAIAVTFEDAETLETCIEATRAIRAGITAQ